MNTPDSLVSDFVKICQGLADLNLEVGPSGNISTRGDNGNVYITPSGSEFRDITAKHISVVEGLGQNKHTGPKPSSDLASHLAIYEKRQDVNVILHTHAHPVVLAAMIGAPIPVLNTMHADYFGKQIPCTPFTNHRLDALGRIEYFEKDNVFLLGKHGGLLLFPELDVKRIINTMCAFNEACSLYYDFLSISHNLSEDVQEISDEDLSHIHDYYQTSYGAKPNG